MTTPSIWVPVVLCLLLRLLLCLLEYAECCLLYQQMQNTEARDYVDLMNHWYKLLPKFNQFAFFFLFFGLQCCVDYLLKICAYKYSVIQLCF